MKLCISRNLRRAAIPVFLGLGLWSLTGCGTGKNLVKTAETSPENVSVAKPDVYLNHRLLYKTFSAKADARLITEDQNQKLNLKISMHKDQDIWASAVAMGMLEVARAYATPDSVFALNRLNKTAYALGYSQGAALLQADIPFSSLQDLFTGSPLLPANALVTNMLVKDSTVAITQQKDSFVQVLEYDVRTQALRKLTLQATNRPFQCTIDYGNYQKIGIGQSFSYDRNIVISNNGKTTKLSINFTQANIDQPILTNFMIPASYDVKHEVKKAPKQ